ncbi:MAG TPA: hypothetical protein VFS79_10860 [Arthrobacter sp.]|nr:hypothetical protein [Arthrobacter sp.]
MQGLYFSGNLFFDPLATGLAPVRMQDQDLRGNEVERPRRGTQTPAEQKALRAASLSKVSKDLERMLRERMR